MIRILCDTFYKLFRLEFTFSDQLSLQFDSNDTSGIVYSISMLPDSPTQPSHLSRDTHSHQKKSSRLKRFVLAGYYTLHTAYSLHIYIYIYHKNHIHKHTFH